MIICTVLGKKMRYNGEMIKSFTEYHSCIFFVLKIDNKTGCHQAVK